MPGRLAAAVLASLAVFVAAAIPAVPAQAADSFVVVQMNLCNSGMVRSCFTAGRAVDEAVERIDRYRPDLVTLQEICRDDLFAPGGRITRAMAGLYGARQVSAEFMPAWNPFTRQPYRCVNGQEYGIGLVHRGTGQVVHQGWYTAQDTTDEWRSWICATVVPGRLTGCTTHLSTDPDVSMRQCRELMTSIVASPWVAPDLVVAGDLNILESPPGPHTLQACEPPGYDHRGDSAVQQVLFSRDLRWIQGRREPMRFTDHPLLYQRFRV